MIRPSSCLALGTAKKKRRLACQAEAAKAVKAMLLHEQGYKRVIPLVASHIKSLEVKRAMARGSGIQHWIDEIRYYTHALNALRAQAEKVPNLRYLE